MTLSCHCPETGHLISCGHWEPPWSKIVEDHPEVKKIQEDIDLASIGAQGFKIMKGAMDEGATIIEAMLVVAAWFKAAGTQDPDQK